MRVCDCLLATGQVLYVASPNPSRFGERFHSAPRGGWQRGSGSNHEVQGFWKDFERFLAPMHIPYPHRGLTRDPSRAHLWMWSSTLSRLKRMEAAILITSGFPRAVLLVSCEDPYLFVANRIESCRESGRGPWTQKALTRQMSLMPSGLVFAIGSSFFDPSASDGPDREHGLLRACNRDAV